MSNSNAGALAGKIDTSALPRPGLDVDAAGVPFRPAAAALVLFEENTDRKPGRPSLLTAWRVYAILDALETGASTDEAADAAALGRRTLHRWLEMGRKAVPSGDSPPNEFRQLWQLAEHSRAMYRRSLERVVHRAAMTDGKLALKVLERRYPKDWRLRLTIETEEGPAALQARELLATKLEQIERRLGAGGVDATTVPESPAARAERESAEDDG